VKKLFSLALVLVLFATMAALVGCNGLWGFDDDDDVVGPIGTKFSLSGVVEIPGDGIDSNGDGNDNTNLRAVKVSDGLKAEVWKKVAGKADEKVHTGDVSSEGKYTLEFYNSPAYYFIRVIKGSEVNVANPAFKMLVVLGSLAEATANKTGVTVNASSTAVAVLMEKADADTTVDPVKFEAERKADVDLLAAELNTALEAAAKDSTKEFVIDTVVSATQFPVAEVKLNKSTANMSVGTNETLTAVASPTYAYKTKEEWISSDETIATVAGGVVTPKLPGTVEITYKFYGVDSLKAEKIVSDKCVVTVVQPVTGVKLDQEALNLFKGNEVVLSVTVEPANASNKQVSWSSSNNAVVEVTADASDASKAKVTAKDVGEATITVKTADGNKTALCLVKVAAVPINISSIVLNPTSLALSIGGTTGTLNVVYDPSDANTQKTVEWKSDNESVATVVGGVVSPKSVGVAKVTVTVTDNDGKVFTATADVTVQKQLSKTVTLKKEVTGLALKTMVIKIQTATAGFNTTTSLVDANGKAWTLEKSENLSSDFNCLTLQAVGVTNIDFLTTWKPFTTIEFSDLIPADAVITIYDINDQVDVTTNL